MGQGKAFGTTGTVADPVAPEPDLWPPPTTCMTASPGDSCSACAAAAGSPPRRARPTSSRASRGRAQDVRDLEEVIKTTEQTKWVLDAAQATALARYAATGEEPEGVAFARDERVEYPVGHESDYADSDLAPVCEWSVRSAAGRLSSATQTRDQDPCDALAVL